MKRQSKEYLFKCPICNRKFYSGNADRALTCLCGHQLLKGKYNLWKRLLFKLTNKELQ